MIEKWNEIFLYTFREYLDADISLPEDKVHHVADCVMSHGSAVLRELRRLFLVEDMIDSFKVSE